MDEIWKAVTSKEAWLEVSNLGRVRSLPSVRVGMREGRVHLQRRQGTLFSPFLNRGGYRVIAPKFGASRRKVFVHRLVADEFVPGYFDGACVNHIDGNKTNNRCDNLEWTTLAENTRLQWATGLVNLRGEKHPSSKITDIQTEEIRARRRVGERVASLAAEYGISTSLIYMIMKGTKHSYIA